MYTSGGSRISRWGGANLRHVHFLVKTYVKTKEMDPVGGACAGGAPDLDPPMYTFVWTLGNTCLGRGNIIRAVRLTR